MPLQLKEVVQMRGASFVWANFSQYLRQMEPVLRLVLQIVGRIGTQRRVDRPKGSNSLEIILQRITRYLEYRLKSVLILFNIYNPHT